MSARLLAVALTVISILTAAGGRAAPIDAAAANTLWVAEQDGVMRLSSAHGELLFEIRDIQDVRAVAVDLRHGTVWAYAKRTLASYDFTGRTQLAIPVNTSDSVQAAIAVAPADGAVWLAVGQRLLNVSAAGQVLNSLQLPANVVELEVDPLHGLLWTATSSTVQALDLVSGAAVRSLQLPANAVVSGVGADMQSDRVWVALKDEVRLFGPSGELLLAGSLPGLTQVSSDLAGGAWVTTAKTVSRLTANGTVLSTTTPFDGTGVIGKLAAAGDRTLWLANQDSIGHLSAAGTVLQRLGFQPPVRIRDLAVNADALAPELAITSPASGACLADATPTLQLGFSDAGWGVAPGSVVVSANAVAVPVSCAYAEDRATCELSNPLADGTWTLAAAVQDYAGNRSAIASVDVKVDTTAPAITIESPADSLVTDQQSVAIKGAISETATLTVNGVGVSLDGALRFTYATDLAEGDNSFTFLARDCAGNQGSKTLRVTYQPNTSGLPPDPATVASPIHQSTITDFASATSFLYQGSRPVQTGVAPGTIDSARAAVIRGRVIDRNGGALPGVTISVHGHPELGQTKSRTDGMFDLAVNGGGVLVLEYAKDGYVSAQRDVTTEWRDYSQASTVALVAYDIRSTAVQGAAASIQVARATTVEDDDGQRTATVVFQPGTSAEMVMADGSRRPLDTLTVRATEFTVGENGLAAMPAALPPTTAYTYAVELSVDEATSAGATSVAFNKSVYFYVENFLGFRTGGIVPSGFYDRQRALWVPSENGRVISVVGTSADGLALVDVTGSGGPSDDSALAALGFTTAEREELARLYPTGTSLWRVPLAHFTPCDFNWPRRPPLDAVPPPDPDDDDSDTDIPDKPEHPDNDRPDKPKEHPKCTGGSVIECENQVLGESIPLAGTPYRLTYRSRQSAGFYWDVRLSGPSVPASLKRIELRLSIAGRDLHLTFAPTANQVYRFVWDGRDIYGRRLQGRQVATAVVGFVYDQEVLVPKSIVDAFGVPPLVQTMLASGRLEMLLEKTAHHALGGWDPRGEQIGGWSLSGQHVYDQNTQILYLGTGEQREIGDVRWIARTIAGRADFIHPGHRTDGGQAYNFDFDVITAVASAADGSVYVGADFSSSTGQKLVYRITPDGIIRRFAGGGSSLADGISARSALLNGANDLAIGKDGSVYIMTLSAVRKVLPDGTITTVLSNLPKISGITLSPAGELYITTTGTSVFGDGGAVYHVTPEGKLRQIASSPLPTDVATDADGNVYVCDAFQGFIRKLQPSGDYGIYAGAGFQDPGDGGTASNAYITGCLGVDVAADGSLYFVDRHEAFTTSGGRLRKISPSAIMSTLAGGPRVGSRSKLSDPEGGPAIGGEYSQFISLAVEPDGTYLVAENNNDPRVYRISSRFPRFSTAGSVIPSAKGSLLYIFNGPLQETRSALTGGVLAKYEYDDNGLLVAVLDAAGRRTRIQRDPSGRAAAVIAPNGETTNLSYDGDDLLVRAAAPGNQTYELAYYPGALLRTFKNPRGIESTFTYSATGRLLSDRNGAAETKSLSRLVRGPGRYRVLVTTAEGRVTSHGVEELGGVTTRTTVDASGATYTGSVDGTGTVRETLPDGTVRTSTLGGDPRWGMDAPLTKTFSVRTPAGLTLAGGAFQTLTLNDPNDLMSIRTIDESLFVNARTTRSLFDASAHTFTLTSPQGRRFVSTIDGFMRPTALAPQGLEPMRLGYDSEGHLASVLRGSGLAERKLLFAYEDGRLKSVTDPLGRVTEYGYDAAGRLDRQSFPGNRVVVFSYDENGNLSTVGPPGRPLHGFSYDLADRRTSYTPPELDFGVALTRFGYDHDGNLTAVTKPSGKLLTLHYDGAGRLDTLSSEDGALQLAYDPSSSRLQRLTTPSGDQLSFAYDGFLPTGETWTGTIQGSMQRTFDKNFWLTAEGVTGGSSVSFVRDQDGLISTAGALQLGRNTAGNIGSMTLGTVQTQNDYNSFGELAGTATTIAGTEVFGLTYQRDLLGRVSSVTQRLGGAETTFGYDYDAAGRLARVTRNGVDFESYQYDANGNRSTAVDPWGSATGDHDQQDRVTRYGAEVFTYNHDGGLETRSEGSATTEYQYDAVGRLKSVRLADGRMIEYLADGEGRRIGKRVNGTLVAGWLYRDGVRPIAQLDASNAIAEQFVYVLKSGAPAYMIKGGSTYRMVTDHLGSVRLVVNADTGEVVQQLDYDAFGRVMFDSSPGFQPFGFAGGLYDHMTGLVHFGAREYDPRIGRWLSKDPLLFDSRDTNFYSYSLADPVNLSDPSGLQTAYCGVQGGAAHHVAGGVEGIGWIDANGNYGTAGQVGAGVGYQVPGVGIVFGVTTATGEEMGGEGGQLGVGGPDFGVAVTRSSGTSNGGVEGSVGIGGMGAAALETYTVMQTNGNIVDDATHLWQRTREAIDHIWDALFNDPASQTPWGKKPTDPDQGCHCDL